MKTLLFVVRRKNITPLIEVNYSDLLFFIGRIHARDGLPVG